MKRHIIISGVVLLLLLLGFFTYIAFRPPAGKPKVMVRFLGYKNLTTGVRLAAFTISNASPWAVTCSSHYWVEVPAGKRWTTFSEDWLATGNRTLRAGAAELVTFAAPTNQNEWRASFISFKAEMGMVELATGLLIQAQKLGLPTHCKRIGYWVRSDLIRINNDVEPTPTSTPAR